jgi:hypothetical protein
MPEHILVGHGQRVRLGADARNHRDRPARHVANADGQHHDGEGGLAEDGPDHRAFQQHAKQRHARHGAQHRQPIGEAQQRHARQRAEGAQHHQFALREADRLGRLVDEHESQRDQPIDAPLGDTADDQLKQLHLVSVGSAAVESARRVNPKNSPLTQGGMLATTSGKPL